MYLATEDTIVAVSTPPGRGALGVVRLSGPRAVSIAAAVFILPPPHRLPTLRPTPCTTAAFSTGTA
jgi:tRNA U34 5-carboxymethylaminomethyl modifying GTPase MnmE/TrmE